MSFVKRQMSNSKGFSLIELLVVFTIVTIISGIGFASFVSYSQRQIVVQAASNMKQAIDLAKFNAQSSVKPAGCDDSDDLTFYQFGVNVETYDTTASCGGNNPVMQTGTLPGNVTFDGAETDCDDITFYVLTGVVEGAPCSIKLTGYGNEVTISVDAVGNASL